MLNHFYAQINGGRPEYTAAETLWKKSNKDKDNSPKTVTDRKKQIDKYYFIIFNKMKIVS